jgi:hypothetical protein
MGIKVGANYTFFSDNNLRDFSPKIGYHFGYVWGIKLNKLYTISIEGMYTQISATGNLKADYISAPIGFNYSLKNAYIGAGYEFRYSISSDFPVNTYDHALFLQTAYQIRPIDIVLKYARSLNEESYYTSKANTIQLSLVLNF